MTARKKDEAQYPAIDPADFATAVIDLYVHAVRGEFATFKGDDREDVRKVAFGLAALRQSVDVAISQMDLRTFVATGMIQALGIIDALTSGRDHPIQKHISGLRTGTHRPQNAPPGVIEELGRHCAVALVRELRKTGLNQTEALNAVISTIKSPSFSPTFETLKGWDRHSRDDPKINARQQQFAKEADAMDASISQSERLLNSGKRWILGLWLVPTVPHN